MLAPFMLLHSVEYTDRVLELDQQLGQLYELMQAIRKQGREDGGDGNGLP